MLEFLLVVVLLFVFAPLWIMLVYLAAILILYVIVFFAAGISAAVLTGWLGGSAANASIIRSQTPDCRQRTKRL